MDNMGYLFVIELGMKIHEFSNINIESGKYLGQQDGKIIGGRDWTRHLTLGQKLLKKRCQKWAVLQSL